MTVWYFIIHMVVFPMTQGPPPEGYSMAVVFTDNAACKTVLANVIEKEKGRKLPPNMLRFISECYPTKIKANL